MTAAQELAAAVISDLAKGAIIEREQAMKEQNGKPIARTPQASAGAVAGPSARVAARKSNQGLDEHPVTTQVVLMPVMNDASRLVTVHLMPMSSASSASPDAESVELGMQADSNADGRAGERSEEARDADGGGGDEEGAADDDAATKGDRLGAIAAGGGITPLVGLVTNGSQVLAPTHHSLPSPASTSLSVTDLTACLSAWPPFRASQMGKERAASALWHLSVDAVNQLLIAKAGGIAPLVQLLEDGTVQATVYAAEAIDRLARDNPDIQTQIAKKLVTLLVSKEWGAQQRSAHALKELARRHPGASVRIVNAGAISPLVSLLGIGSIEAKEEAVGALSELAHNDVSNQLAIATGLVALLGSGSAEGQVHVTQMLIKFAEEPDNRSAIARAGAIDRLIMQLRGGGDDMALKAQELAAVVLSYLSSDSDDNVHKIVGSGGIKPLIALLSSPSIVARARAAAVLSDMTRNFADIQAAVARDGAIDPLIHLCAADPPLWSEEMMAMKDKDRVQRERDGGTDDGGAGSMADEAAHESASFSAKRQDATSKPTAPGEAAAVLPSSEPVPPAAKARRMSMSGKTAVLGVGVGSTKYPPEFLAARSEAAGALWSLSHTNTETQAAIAQQGGISLLCALLREDSPEAQRKASGALASLAIRSPPNQDRIRKAGGVPLLVGLLDGKHSDEVRAQAATALAELARGHTENQSACSGAVGACVVLLSGDASERAKVEAASAIWSFCAGHPTNQVAVAAAGGIPPLVRLIGVGSKHAQHEAAGALASIALGNDENEVAIASQVVALLSSDAAVPGVKPRDVATKAAKAIASLARSAPSNQVAIAKVDGITPLVKLLRSEASKSRGGGLRGSPTGGGGGWASVAMAAAQVGRGDLACEVVSALWSIAECNGPNQEEIAAQGAVPYLTTLLASGKAEVQHGAAGALWALAASQPTNQRLIAAEGAIEPLIALFTAAHMAMGDGVVGTTGIGRDDAHETSAGALKCLAGLPENRVAIADAGGIAALVGLFETGRQASTSSLPHLSPPYHLLLPASWRVACAQMQYPRRCLDGA